VPFQINILNIHDFLLVGLVSITGGMMKFTTQGEILARTEFYASIPRSAKFFRPLPFPQLNSS
jgi:hypothetical protein